MSEDDLNGDSQPLTRWEQHRFMLLVGGTIMIALFLVGVALALYASSGAAQLDLSRPGYQSVRDQAVQTGKFDEFPSTGQLDREAIGQFRSLFDKQVEQVTGVDSFGGSPMSDQTLSIDALPVEDAAAQ